MSEYLAHKMENTNFYQFLNEIVIFLIRLYENHFLIIVEKVNLGLELKS